MEQEEKVESSSKSSNKTVIIVVVVIVLAGAGWFFSRGSVMTPAGVNIDRNIDGSATYSNEEGSVTVGANSYPDNWPSDAPKYNGAKIQYSGTSNPQTRQVGTAVVFATSDDTQKVVDFYKKELPSNGWTIEQTATMGEMTIISAKKGNSTFAAQIVKTEDGQTAVTVAIGI